MLGEDSLSSRVLDAPAREDAKQLLAVAAHAVLQAKAAFPAQAMMHALREETVGRIDDVHLRWRLDPAAKFSVQVDVILADRTKASCLISSEKWAQRIRLGEDRPEPTDAAPLGDDRVELSTMRAYVLQCALGERCRDVMQLEGRLAKPPPLAPMKRDAVHSDVLQLLQCALCFASLSAVARFRHESLLSTCLHLLRPDASYDRLRLPAPVCALDPSASIVLIPETWAICRTFSSASECLTDAIARLCNRTYISEELHASGGYPAFHTSAEEEFHTTSTLAPVVAQEVAELGCSVGLTFVPPDASGKKDSRRGFVSAPPPPVPYEKFHSVFRSPTEVQSSLVHRTTSGAAGLRIDEDGTWYAFVHCDDAARLAKMDPSSDVTVIAVVHPLSGTLSSLLTTCANMRRENIPFAFDLTYPECMAGCGNDSGDVLPSLAVACGASFVFVPPPRGAQNTSLYNEFMRLEEELVERQGFCYVTPTPRVGRV